MRKPKKNLNQSGKSSSNFNEFDLEEEAEDGSKLVKVGKILLALVLVLVMVYFSGIREYFFFRRTPESATITEMEKVLEVESVDLPVTVFLIRNSRLGTVKNYDEIESLIRNGSSIMSQAGIDLIIDDFIEKEMATEEIIDLIDGDFDLIAKRDGVNLILVKTLGQLNGLAYPGRDVVIMPDYLAGRNYRTFAHEIGHLLGLGHVEDGRYVMSQGSTGVLFSKEEVIKMRKRFDEKF